MQPLSGLPACHLFGCAVSYTCGAPLHRLSTVSSVGVPLHWCGQLCLGAPLHRLAPPLRTSIARVRGTHLDVRAKSRADEGQQRFLQAPLPRLRGRPLGRIRLDKGRELQRKARAGATSAQAGPYQVSLEGIRQSGRGWLSARLEPCDPPTAQPKRWHARIA